MIEFDRDALLERTLGDPLVMRRVLGVFLIEARDGLRALEATIGRANFRFAREFAYGLRVAAANAGASRVEQAAACIERAAALPDLGGKSATEFRMPLRQLAREIEVFASAVAPELTASAKGGRH